MSVWIWKEAGGLEKLAEATPVSENPTTEQVVVRVAPGQLPPDCKDVVPGLEAPDHTVICFTEIEKML